MSEQGPPSPCINVCVLDEETQTCRGCCRTLDEIAGWSGFSAEEKRAILRQLDARKRAGCQQRDPDAL